MHGNMNVKLPQSVVSRVKFYLHINWSHENTAWGITLKSSPCIWRKSIQHESLNYVIFSTPYHLLSRFISYILHDTPCSNTLPSTALRTALFWALTQTVVVIPYRRSQQRGASCHQAAEKVSPPTPFPV